MTMALPVAPTQLPVRELGFEPIGRSPSPAAAPASGPSFADRVRELAQDVNQSQRTAQTVADEYAAGRRNDLHGTMIAMSQADITLRLLANVRNKVIEAYREIMRMGA